MKPHPILSTGGNRTKLNPSDWLFGGDQVNSGGTEPVSGFPLVDDISSPSDFPLVDEIPSPDAVMLTPQEYIKWLNVRDLGADLFEIKSDGERVAAHLFDPEWQAQLENGYQSITAFLHRPESKLIRKIAMPYYMSNSLHNAVIVVVGAGPGGLRFAVEAALLGATVHVIDSRTRFNRYNVLKLWAYSMEDLMSLGVKDLYPEFTLGKVKRIPIAILQHTLLRVALALGVAFYPGCKCGGFKDAGGGTALLIDNACPYRDDLDILRFNAVFDATAKGLLRDSSFRGEDPLIATGRRPGQEALGITMNFKRFDWETEFYRRSKDDPRFAVKNPGFGDENNAQYTYYQDLFNDKEVLLENWAYWRSAESHYVVCTIPRNSLFKHKVVIDNGVKLSTSELLKQVDQNALVDLGLKIAKEWNFPHSSDTTDAFIVNWAGKPDIAIFEYGRSRFAKAAARFLPYSKSENPILFGLIGDNMEEPFWPYGTGANRAIYSAQLQAMTMIAWWGEGLSEMDIVNLATSMMKKMFEIPLHGNDPKFKIEDYEKQIADNYQAIEKRLPTRFY